MGCMHWDGWQWIYVRQMIMSNCVTGVCFLDFQERIFFFFFLIFCLILLRFLWFLGQLSWEVYWISVAENGKSVQSWPCDGLF